jgi:hypothetical protein
VKIQEQSACSEGASGKYNFEAKRKQMGKEAMNIKNELKVIIYIFIEEPTNASD